MMITEYHGYRVNSNWLRLAFFFILWIFLTVLFSFPAFIAFPGTLKHEAGHSYNILFLTFIQAAGFAGAAIAFHILKTVIEKKQYTIRFNFVAFIRGSLISLTMLTTNILVLLLCGLTSFNIAGSDEILLQIILFFLVALTEEIICRGYILMNLLEKLKPSYAIALSSIFFGAFHIGNDSFGWISFITITLSGILLSVVYLKHKNLWVPIGMHFTWNFMQGPIFGFGVSGYKDSSLLSILSHTNYDYLTGGDFGIEGSIILIPILLITIFFVVRRQNLFRNNV